MFIYLRLYMFVYSRIFSLRVMFRLLSFYFLTNFTTESTSVTSPSPPTGTEVTEMVIIEIHVGK